MNAANAERGHQLTTEQKASAELFYAGLTESERAKVEGVITVVDRLAREFYAPIIPGEGNLDSYASPSNAVQSTAYGCYTHVREVVNAKGETELIPKNGYPFFNVYATGKHITEPGASTPDVDLIVASNAFWIEFQDSSVVGTIPTDERFEHCMLEEQPLATALLNVFVSSHHVEVLSELPTNYNKSQTKGKSLIRCMPSLVAESKFDITLVRGIIDDSGTDPMGVYQYLTPEEFEDKDVDSVTGDALPKVLLYSFGHPIEDQGRRSEISIRQVPLD